MSRFIRYSIGLILAVMVLYWSAVACIATGFYLKLNGVWGLVGFSSYVAFVGGVSFWAIALRKRCLKNAKSSQLAWGMAIVAFVVQIVFIVIVRTWFGQSMISDFTRAQQCLESGRVMTLHHPMFKYWVNYEMILSLLGSLTVPSLWVGQLLNAVCIALSVYPIYRIADSIAGKDVGIVVSALSIFYPTNLMYGTILTQEYICAALIVWGVYLLLKAFESEALKRVDVVNGCLAAIVLSAAELVKPVVPIVWAGLIVSLLFRIGTFANKKWPVMCVAKLFFVIFAMYIISYKSFSVLDGYLIERVSSQKCPAQSAVPWKQLLIGLDVESRGVYTTELAQGYNLSDAEARERCIAKMKRNIGRLPHLVGEKMIRLHWSDRWASNWFLQTLKRTSDCDLSAFAQAGFLINVFMILLSASTILCTYWKRALIDMRDVFPLVILFGFTMLIGFLEMQCRYRTSIYPVYFLSMALGLEFALKRLSRLCCKGNQDNSRDGMVEGEKRIHHSSMWLL